MENASKALLIAAAVLIVIMIIAVGMRVLNASGNGGADQAKQTGNQVLTYSNQAANSATNSMKNAMNLIQ